LPDHIDEVSVVEDDDLSMTGAAVATDEDEEVVEEAVEEAAEEAVEEAVEWPDISDELEELDFYLAQDLEDDARVTYLEIVRQHPGHPGLAAFSHLMEESSEETAAQGEESLVDVDEEAPSFSFDDDEDDGDYLAAIFDSESTEKETRKSASKVEHKARAEVSDAAATDHYDLGVAYHGMGLSSDAIAAFDRAAEDPEWKCRAAIMVANILSSQGDVDGAVARLQDGLELARNDDETSQSQFEIALLLKQQGDDAGALEAMEKVAAGFRDRDDRLAEWRG
jgi:tetratricopeptide (TPR) repeat protein